VKKQGFKEEKKSPNGFGFGLIGGMVASVVEWRGCFEEPLIDVVEHGEELEMHRLERWLGGQRTCVLSHWSTFVQVVRSVWQNVAWRILALVLVCAVECLQVQWALRVGGER
jgi:hypothetical protein